MALDDDSESIPQPSYLRHADSTCGLVNQRFCLGTRIGEGLRCVAEVGYIIKRQAFFNPKCFRLTRARAASNGFGRKLFYESDSTRFSFQAVVKLSQRLRARLKST
jgi:hypothetical protein